MRTVQLFFIWRNQVYAIVLKSTIQQLCVYREEAMELPI